MARKVRSPITRIRRLVLAVLVLGVAALVGLFWFGRAGQQAERAEVPRTEPLGDGGGENLALIGKDFDYTFTEGEKPLFRIRGESVKADREETIYLEKVALTLYDKDGRAFEVASQQAAFNRVHNEGKLEGDVRLAGPDGLTLETPLLLLQDKGKLVSSTQPVRIGYAGKYAVSADLLRIHLDQEVYVLVGHVALDSVPSIAPAVALRADRAVYDRRASRLRAEGKVALSRGGDRLHAQIINAFLGPDEQSLVFVRAVLDVAGTIAGRADRPGAAQVAFSGKTLGMLTPPNEGAAREIALEGEPGAPATLVATGSGVTRKLTARTLEGRMLDGVMKTARGVGGVDLHETTGAKKGEPAIAPRTAHALGVISNFGPTGQLAEAILQREVRFADGRTTATGNHAVLELDSGEGEFFGSPVEAVSDRGRVTGPHVVWERRTGILRADGGVRALLTRAEDAGLAGSALGSGKGPIWVDAREALYRTNPQSFLFRGNVRAWRGKDLLLAQELRGDKTEDRLIASGGVKSLWIPEAEELEPGEKPQEPIEVSAASMVYRQTGRKLEYHEAVQVVQAKRSLRCKDLVVDLKEDKKAEKMVCTGGARLLDPASGRDIAGERAVYLVDGRQIEITGSPVKMKDKDGNQVQGRQVIYFVDGGRAEVRSRAEEPAAAPSPPPAQPRARFPE